MRLWHQSLLNELPREQLLGQHRECCALRGKGWGRKHATVDYVFKYDLEKLCAYHFCVLDEMEYRGYKVNPLWWNGLYRGKILGFIEDFDELKLWDYMHVIPVYEEHDGEYLKECVENLKNKGIEIK